MLKAALVDEVKRLLALPGFSQRKIARVTGVSRASIGAIASGRRPDYPARCHPLDEEDEDDQPRGLAERCRSCGGMVYMPCRLCRVRALKFTERERTRARSCAAKPHHVAMTVNCKD